jgi:hypothetical protein
MSVPAQAFAEVLSSHEFSGSGLRKGLAGMFRDELNFTANNLIL